MKKRVTNINNIGKLVRERLLDEDCVLSENKINKIIKKYISEGVDDEYVEDKLGVSEKSHNALEDMMLAINEMIGDLEVMRDGDDGVYINDSLDLIMDDLISAYDRINDLGVVNPIDDVDYDDELEY